MLETGIFSKHHRHWILKKPKCSFTSSYSSVGLEFMAGMITILTILYISTIGLMLCENIYFYYQINNK